MKAHIVLVGLVCNISLLSHDVIANDITFNGFFSAGGGIAIFDDDEDAENGEKLGGYEDNLTFNQELLFALQVSAPVNDQLSLTGQLVAEGGSNDYGVEAAWAYAAYELNEELTLRAGRFRRPFYFYSDYLEVGYAYHWVSPPSEIYNVPFNSVDGVDAVWSFPISEVNTTIQVYTGGIDGVTDGDIAIDTKVRDIFGIVLTLNYDWLTLRGSFHGSETSFDNLGSTVIDPSTGATIDDFANIIRDSGFISTADNLSVDDEQFDFAQFAVKIDWNNILFITEATTFDSSTKILSSNNRYYATLGYTLGDFMVHGTFSKADDGDSELAEDIPVTDNTAALIASLNTLSNSFSNRGTTTTLGIRYDFSPGAAIKLEWSNIEDDLGFDPSGSIVRFSIDTVF